MRFTGQVFKFVGLKGLVRPDKFGQIRKDVLFDKNHHDLKIGDRIEYEHQEKNGRRYAQNIVKIDNKR